MKFKIRLSIIQMLLIHLIIMMFSNLVKEEHLKTFYQNKLLKIPVSELYQDMIQSGQNSGLPGVQNKYDKTVERKNYSYI